MTILEKYHVLETITQEVFDTFYQKYTEEKETIEKGLEACSGSMNISNLPVFLENAITLSRKLNAVWASGNIQLKEDLQKLIFPEGIYYNRKTQSFRTEKANFIFEPIASSSGTPPEKKKGTSYLIDYLSLSAEREGLPSAIPEREASNKKFCSRTSCSFFIPIRFAPQAVHAAGNKKCPANRRGCKTFCLAEREVNEPALFHIVNQLFESCNLDDSMNYALCNSVCKNW